MADWLVSGRVDRGKRLNVRFVSIGEADGRGRLLLPGRQYNLVHRYGELPLQVDLPSETLLEALF